MSYLVLSLNSLFQICSTQCELVVAVQVAPLPHTPPQAPSLFPQLHRLPNPPAAPNDLRETTTCLAKRTLALSFAADTGHSYCQNSIDKSQPVQPWACGNLEQAEREESHDHRPNGASLSNRCRRKVVVFVGGEKTAYVREGLCVDIGGAGAGREKEGNLSDS